MSVIDSNKFNISIHALREESDELLYNDKFKINISIHALREESDRMGYKSISKTVQFQSTLSVRRATKLNKQLKLLRGISIHALREESDGIKLSYLAQSMISIHALREESDQSVQRHSRRPTDFNPRSP